MPESTENRPQSDAHEPGVTPPPVPPDTSFYKKPKIGATQTRKRDMPEGLWKKCPDCEEMIFENALEENLKVCPKCEFHYPFCAYARIDSLVDSGSFNEMDKNMLSVDTLEFTGTDSYAAKLEKYRSRTGLSDAIIIGTGTMGGQKLALGVMDFNFLEWNLLRSGDLFKQCRAPQNFFWEAVGLCKARLMFRIKKVDCGCFGPTQMRCDTA